MRILKSIYWDVDDVALNSLEAAVSLINPTKTLSDVKDWSLRSIDRNLTPSDLSDLFASTAFWGTVRLNPDFQSLLTPSILRSYAHYFVTKGTPENLAQKQEFLQAHLPQYDYFEFIGISTSKSTIDMSDGILIDDNIENILDSNAALSILLTNNLSTQYNNAFGDYDTTSTNLYIVNDLSEVKQILDFNLKHDLITL